MGNCWARVVKRRKMRRHIVLILIGLDNAGKTKTVNNLAGEVDEKVLPTVGFKAINLNYKETPITIFDLGGGPQFRSIWSQYYSEVHGVIFVIDSSDFSRLDECRSVLEEVLSHHKISGKPILVLANKQDKSGALDDIDVVEKLNIEPLVNRYRCPTLVESYSAEVITKNSKKPKVDPGLKRGYYWLINYILRRYGDINLRVQTDIHADLERRKIMLNKTSNASQTLTQLSDEIATQTGFENPNFVHQKSENTENFEKGLIIVKPVNHCSIDSTITIESAETENSTSGGKPKLSPLFGRSSNSNSNPESGRIELEPKSEFRKLSPIVSNKSGGDRHIDFHNRPQSSPTQEHVKNLKLEVNSPQVPPPVPPRRQSHTAPRLGPRGVNEQMSSMHPRELLTDRADYTSRAAASETGGSPNTSVPNLRPASASELVRKQLELCGSHKRRLSLRYMHRNKTSPERISMVVYESNKSMQKNYEQGDFQQASAGD